MKRLAILLTAFSVLTACNAGVLPAPEPQPAVTSVEPAPVIPATQSPARKAPEHKAKPAPPPETKPAPPPVAEQPLSPLKNLVQVPAPALSDLPQSYRDVLMQRSPWAVALGAVHWYHGSSVIEGPFLAPGLQAKLETKGAAERIWVKLIKSWEGGPDRFYFHVQVVAERKDGALYQAGLDVIETSMVRDGGPVVTGYAHAPAAAAPGNGTVSVWVHTGGAPRELELAHPAVEAGGEVLIPLKAVEELGTLPVDLKTVLKGGVPCVAVADLVQLLDGRRVSGPEGSFLYGARWMPELHQLILTRDHSYPLS